MNKALGYLLAIIGIIGIAAWAVPQIKTALKIPAGITDLMLLIISGLCATLGIYLVTKFGSKKIREVPIYHGKHVVGFRRIK